MVRKNAKNCREERWDPNEEAILEYRVSAVHVFESLDRNSFLIALSVWHTKIHTAPHYRAHCMLENEPCIDDAP